MAKQAASWHQRIGGNRALVLGIMIVMLCLFTVDFYILPALGVGSRGGDYVRFTVDGRVVAFDENRIRTMQVDWHRFQAGQARVTGRFRSGMGEFLEDLMKAELAKDAGISVTEGTLREFIETHPMFRGNDGEFDPAAFDRALGEHFGGIKPRPFEEEARRHLLVDHFMKIYANTFLTVNDDEAYKRWKADYPKIEVAFAWSPVAPARAGLRAEDLKPEEVESFWKNDAVRARHRLPPRFAFEAAALKVVDADDQACKDAREAWKDDPDLKADPDEAYRFWFDSRRFDFAIASQAPETVEALRRENEEAVKAEEEARKKDPAAGPKDPSATGPEEDLSKVPPDKLVDREQYRRIWRHRIEKEVWLRKLVEKVLKEAKEGKRPLAEVAEKWSRPGLRIRVHRQEEPVDQYGVEKIPGLGGPNCGLRWAINGYKPEQAGTYHPELVRLTANADRLDERGWLAFQVVKAVGEEVPPLDSVREGVVGELLDERARDRARSEMESLRKAAEDARKPLEEAAKERGLEPSVAGPFNAYSWRPPAPRPVPGKDAPAASDAWKDPNRRVSAVMSRYAALRDTPAGSFGAVLDDASGSGAFYLVQVKSRSEPRFEEMTQAQILMVRRVVTRERLGGVGMALSYGQLKERLGLHVAGGPAEDLDEEGRPRER